MSTDMDTDEFITTTMRRVADAARPPAGAAYVPMPAPARRRILPVAVAAAAATVAAVTVAAVTWTGDSDSGSPTGLGSSDAATTTGCRLDYQPAPLPEWARAGFTPPDQAVPYVLGDRGDMAAILWDTHHPLEAPPAAGENNKILWVARVGAADGPLEIRATLEGSGRTVSRVVSPAPGPSGIDLPSPGCWSVDLTWGSHSDHLMLGYAAG